MTNLNCGQKVDFSTMIQIISEFDIVLLSSHDSAFQEVSTELLIENLLIEQSSMPDVKIFSNYGNGAQLFLDGKDIFGLIVLGRDFVRGENLSLEYSV